MMTFDVLIFAILTTGAVLIVGQVARLLRMAMLHRTIRKAIDRDSAAVPDLLAGIEEKPAPNTDDRTGLVLIALAAAVFLFGVIQGDAEDIRNMGGIALFPAFVGAALLGRFLYIRRSHRI
jgi:hypothetical protein